MHCAYMWEPSEMRNSKVWLELGVIYHLKLKSSKFLEK